MSVYKLLENTDPLLELPLLKCNDNLDRKELKENLIETMKHYNGIGLSANQCGVLERAFVFYADFEKRLSVVCFNPQIVETSTVDVEMVEGCLTYPGLWLKIKRPEWIGATFEDETGAECKGVFKELEGRTFLHEYDHMEGTNFTDKVSRLKLDMARKRVKKQLKRAENLKKAMASSNWGGF
jgi:peptide deformylase